MKTVNSFRKKVIAELDLQALWGGRRMQPGLGGNVGHGGKVGNEVGRRGDGCWALGGPELEGWQGFGPAQEGPLFTQLGVTRLAGRMLPMQRNTWVRLLTPSASVSQHALSRQCAVCWAGVGHPGCPGPASAWVGGTQPIHGGRSPTPVPCNDAEAVCSGSTTRCSGCSGRWQ